MQKLKGEWLVSSKLIWEISQILTRALENLKNLHFNRLLLTKVYNAWAKKSTEELCLIALKIDVTFQGKLSCAFKNDMRNLVNFHQSTFQSLKIMTLMASFYPKWKMYELKIYRGVLCNDNKEWCKIWREIELPVQNWHDEFDKLWPEHLKILKTCTLIDCFWPMYIMFELKKV